MLNIKQGAVNTYFQWLLVWLDGQSNQVFWVRIRYSNPDDWGRPDGRVPRSSCLAISAHLSNRGAGTTPPRWGGETLVQYSLWRRNLSHNSLFCHIASVFSKELVLPRLIRCELSRLCCHGHSLLLFSYLCRITRKNSSCSACGHPLQDQTHLTDAGLSRIRASPARHLWHYFFHFWPLVKTLGRGPTDGSPWSSSTPPSLERSRVVSPPYSNPMPMCRRHWYKKLKVAH